MIPDRSSGFGTELKLETVNSICFPFVAGTSSLTVSIEGHSFRCLLDSGAAVTAISAKVWQDCLRHAYPNLDRPSLESVTSVNGCRLSTLGKTLFEFVIDSRIFPFEARVIEDLAYDVIIRRDLLQKFCFKIDFENGVVTLSPEDPLPFGSVQLNDSFDDSVGPGETFITSVHASRTYISGAPSRSKAAKSGAPYS